jgi:capsular exopolysaccharide synthesis family protein
MKLNLKKLVHLKPKKKTSQNTEIAILDNNSSFTIKEAYKSLRTNLVFSMGTPKGKAKVLSIVSSAPSEGKTTTAINVAISFAETDCKVLLVDCDLRKPKLHKYTKTKNTVGMSNILGGFAKKEECIFKSSYGFDYILAGRIPPNPAELLSSEKFTETIDALKDQYDYIFIDCPPVNVVSDALTISTYADGVLYVVNPEIVYTSDVAEGIAKLEFINAKIYGFVANAVNNTKSKYTGKYRRYSSKYSGKYGYYYYSAASYKAYEYNEDDKND